MLHLLASLLGAPSRKICRLLQPKTMCCFSDFWIGVKTILSDGSSPDDQSSSASRVTPGGVPLLEHPRPLSDRQPDARAMFDGVREQLPRFFKIAGIQQPIDLRAVLCQACRDCAYPHTSGRRFLPRRCCAARQTCGGTDACALFGTGTTVTRKLDLTRPCGLNYPYGEVRPQ